MFCAKLSLSASILVLLTIMSAQNVFACECIAPSWHNRPISDEFASSDAVITATVASEPEPEKAWFDQQSVRVRVEKVYKGEVKVGHELIFGQGQRTDCIWYFSKANVGNQYLFYLGKPTKTRPNMAKKGNETAETRYYVSTCGRSTEIEKAAEDLSYLDKKASIGALLPELSVLQFQPFVLCK